MAPKCHVQVMQIPNSFRLLLLISLLALLGVSAGAQEMFSIPVERQIIHLSVWKGVSGLPSWHIREIVADKQGLVWFASDRGLTSLDGKRFIEHNLNIPISDYGNIMRLALDARENIWLFCGRPNRTVVIYVYDPRSKQVQSFQEYTGSPLVFQIRIAYNLLEIDGNIWLLDPVSGMGGYFGTDLRWHETLNATPDQTPRLLFYPAGDNTFWKINEAQHDCALVDAQGVLQKQLPKFPNALLCRYVIGKDKNIYLFIGKQHAAGHTIECWRYSPQGYVTNIDLQEALLQPCISSALLAGYQAPPIFKKNNQGAYLLWGIRGLDLDIYQSGKLLYTGLAKYIQKEIGVIPDQRIFVLPDGSFWLLGADALIRIELTENPFTSWFRNWPQSPSTRGIASTKERLFVNSYQGTFEINRRNGEIKRLLPIAGRGLVQQANRLWTGQHMGEILAYDLNTGKTDRYPLNTHETERLYPSPSGKIYAGAPNTAFCLLPGAREFNQLEISGSTRCFYHNPAGLWVGGAGLWLLDSTDHPVVQFTQDIRFKGIIPDINGIHEDSTGVFWMATNQGLWRWRPFTTELTVFDEASNGLPSNKLHAVFEDRRGRLWLPSDDGLLLFDKKTTQFRIFTRRNGLPSDEFNWLSADRSEDGQLHLGGVSGLVSFHPDSISFPVSKTFNLGLLSVFIKDDRNGWTPKYITLDSRSGDQRLSIPANVDQIVLQFCQPAFLQEHQYYHWRIPELDSNWHKLSEPELTLFQLPWGAYTIELSARLEGDGNPQGESVLRIPMYVDRPYYLTWWFILGSALSLLALIQVAFRLRQQQLRQYSNILAKEVAQKTADLQKERDLVSRQAKALIQMDVEKNVFFQNISHEIRNPLSLIISPVNDLLKRENLESGQKAQLERVRRSAEKILNLITEVLELTKLEAGVVRLEARSFLLHAFIKRICTDFELEAQSKEIDFQWDNLIPQSCFVMQDLRKLEKIINNLLQNALKFTPRRGKILIYSEYKDKGWLLIKVQDNGVGIAPENIKHIFDRYYQAAPAQSQSGFGIGLAMCRSYAQLMGGSITAHSQPGQGTTMQIQIPCPPAAQSTTTNQPLEVKIHPPGNKALILLVEEDQDQLKYLAALLEPIYQVVCTENGQEALDWLQHHQPDLIISDLEMSGLNGLHLLTQLRENGQQPDIPFILLSGRGSEKDLLEAQKLGVFAYLSKPAEEPVLLQTIRNAL